jgi:DNA-directed RNA polymerase specialized sigma54-like protein
METTDQGQKAPACTTCSGAKKKDPRPEAMEAMQKEQQMVSSMSNRQKTLGEIAMSVIGNMK